MQSWETTTLGRLPNLTQVASVSAKNNFSIQGKAIENSINHEYKILNAIIFYSNAYKLFVNITVILCSEEAKII